VLAAVWAWADRTAAERALRDLLATAIALA
jgi:hypothetical protein